MPDQIFLALLVLTISIALIVISIAYARHRRAFLRSVDMVFLRVMMAKKDSDQDEKRELTHDHKEQLGLMEQLLANLKALSVHGIKGLIFGQESFSLEYVAVGEEITFYAVIPRRVKILVEKQISSFYPDATIDEVPEVDLLEKRRFARATELVFAKSFTVPFRTYQKLESDPMNAITSALSKIGATDGCGIQIVLTPVDDDWQKKVVDAKPGGHGGSILSLLWSIFDFTSEPEEHKSSDSGAKESENEAHQAAKEKAKKTGYEITIRLLSTGNHEATVDAQLKNMVSAFSQFAAPEYNRFKVPKHLVDVGAILRGYIFRFPHRRWIRRQILTTEEIASIFHFPHSKYNRTPEIRWQNFKIVKAPTNIGTSGILLGHNVFRGVKTPVYIANEDRFRHFYVIGQTGTGKSTMLTVMARQDIANGTGLAVMDPHGDLAKELLPFVPRSRADDIIYFDPSDTERPMGLNLLEARDAEERQTVAQDALAIMIKLFGNEIFGPRLQDYFRNAALTLMEYTPGAALTDIVRLFTDDQFQMERRRFVKDPVVRAWWEWPYSRQGDREKAEIIPFWAAKFGGFITNSMMRNIIGQTKSAFDVAAAMDQSKILLLNLSKGTLGDENSKLVGMILTSKIQMAAMKRQKMSKEGRKDFFLYIDEFQNYVSDSIESILSEARKYRLGLIVAHQYLGQLQKNDALTKSNVNLKDAIFGNVGSIMSYKIGPEDAEFMAKQFAPEFSDQDLVNMDKFKGVAKIAVGGQPTRAFSLTPTNPYLQKGNKQLAETYLQLSRLKYGREREFVDKEIVYRIGIVGGDAKKGGAKGNDPFSTQPL